MIYIKRFNFCFIRIPKNASSSIMLFLYENMCTEEDMISRMFEWDNTKYKKIYYKNCPMLPHSHIDSNYLITNSIVKSDASFYGVVREPLERTLSLYLYRIRDGVYGNIPPSPEHFQSLFVNGVFQDTPQQMQAQSTFLPDTGTYWLYDNVETNLKDLCYNYGIDIKSSLKILNKSPGDTKKLIKYFYSSTLIDKVQTAYMQDFLLYEKLKNNHL